MSFKLSDSDEDSDDPERHSGEGEKMSDLLASYYGISPAEASEENDDIIASEDLSPSAIDDVAQWQIDSPSFDAIQYARHLLYTAPVESLLSKDDELVHEVKALDSDMQMLVYENYNKFIAATETIRKMKHNVDSMDAEMDTLVGNMATIADCSEVVNSSLAAKRSQIDKLVRVRRLLKRLEFLFELPHRLSRSIEQKAYSQTVRYYVMTKDILHNYSHVPSFRNIEVASTDIMSCLRRDLFSSLEKLDNVETLCEHARLLLELQESRECLIPKVVACLTTLFTELLERARGLEVEADTKQESSDTLPSRVVCFSEALLPPFTGALQNLKDLMGPDDALFLDYAAKLSDVVFEKYFGMLESCFTSYLDDSRRDPNTKGALVELLRSIGEGLDHPLIPPSVLSRATDVEQSLITRRIDQVFFALRQSQARGLITLCTTMTAAGSNSEEAAEPLAEIESWTLSLEGSIKDSLDLLLPLFSQNNMIGRAAQQSVASKVWVFLKWLTESIEWFVGSTFRYDSKRVSTSAFTCALSTHSTDQDHAFITSLQDTLGSTNPESQGSRPMRSPVSPKSVLKLALVAEKLTAARAPEFLVPSTEVKEELEKYAHDASARLAAHYVELYSQDLVRLIEYSDVTSGREAEIGSVRREVLQIVRQLSHIAEEATDVLGPQPPSNQAGSLRQRAGDLSRRAHHVSATKGLQLDIARIFTTRVHVFGDVSLSTESILLGVVKALLKAMIESVRSSTPSSNTRYHQVQVDAQLLRQMVPYLLADSSVPDTMLDEVLVSAVERCRNPDTTLDASQVLSIVAQAQSQLATESS